MHETLIARLSREEALELALRRLSAPVPGTKGLTPAERASRFRAELEKRIRLAKEAVKTPTDASNLAEAAVAAITAIARKRAEDG